MKRLLLIASLCVVGIVAAPLASANAATLTGTCEVKGSAKFGPTNLQKTLEFHTYEFEGSATCKDTANQTHIGTITVKEGNGQLACLTAVSEKEGNGVLKETSPGTEEYKFTLSFVATGGQVALVIKVEGKPSATGDATFLKSKNQTPAECLTGGVERLDFEAVAVGTI
jgi:hypothetical protein